MSDTKTVKDLSDREIRRMVAMIQNGMRKTTVAQHFGITREQVVQWWRYHGKEYERKVDDQE